MNSEPVLNKPNNEYNKLFQSIALMVGFWMLIAYLYDQSRTVVQEGAIYMSESYHPAPAWIMLVIAGIASLTSILLLASAKHPGPWLHINNLTFDDMNDRQKKITTDSLYGLSNLLLVMFAAVCIMMVPQFLPHSISLPVFFVILVGLLIYTCRVGIKVYKAK